MKQCVICGKKGKLVWRRVRLRATRYNPTIKRKQYPNLQWVFIPAEIKKQVFRKLKFSKQQQCKKFAGKRVLACAKCIKTLAKRK